MVILNNMNDKSQTNKIRKIIKDHVFLDDLSISKIEFQLQQLEYVVRENQQLKEDYNKVVHEATEFESRIYELEDKINKAIEYVEKCNPDVDLHNMFLNENYISNYGACELLEILKGVKYVKNKR